MDRELSRPSTYEQTTHVVKGKRTKRTRPQSPFMAATSSSASLSGDDRNYCNTDDVVVSPATSAESSDGGATEEEQDLANCLILLAQGSSKEPPPMQDTGEDDDTKLLLGQRLAEPATTTTTATGKYVYECKTCNRSFPSFQALGGHRASHKKAKLVAVGSGVGEEESQVSCLALQAYKHSSSSSPYNSSNAAKSRVHECSICGAEFSSGQALGGHQNAHKRERTLAKRAMRMGLFSELYPSLAALPLHGSALRSMGIKAHAGLHYSAMDQRPADPTRPAGARFEARGYAGHGFPGFSEEEEMAAMFWPGSFRPPLASSEFRVVNLEEEVEENCTSPDLTLKL